MQHLAHQEGNTNGSSGPVEDAQDPQDAVPSPVRLLAALERVLGQRQDLVRQLANLAPTDHAREHLAQRLQQITYEQAHLLRELAAVLPPAKSPMR